MGVDEEKLTFEEELAALISDAVAMFCPEAEGDDGCPVKVVAGEDTVILTMKPKNRTVAAMVIGKEGRMIASLRTIIGAVGRAKNKRFILEVHEPEDGRREREASHGDRRDGGGDRRGGGYRGGDRGGFRRRDDDRR